MRSRAAAPMGPPRLPVVRASGNRARMSLMAPGFRASSLRRPQTSSRRAESRARRPIHAWALGHAGARSARRLSAPARASTLVHPLPTNHGALRLDRDQLRGLGLEDILIPHHQIGQLAGLERALDVLLERG